MERRKQSKKKRKKKGPAAPEAVTAVEPGVVKAAAAAAQPDGSTGVEPPISKFQGFLQKMQAVSKAMVFGINAVTRGLEKKQVKLVLVTRDVQPSVLVQVTIPPSISFSPCYV